MKFIFCLGLAGFVLGGCSGNVKDFACTGQNWAEFGYKVGAEGRSVHEFDKHKSSCGANLERGAVKAYLDGYTRGIVEFCTYDNGYALGSKRLPMSENCPLEVKTAFAKGYAVGKAEIGEKIHHLDKAIDGVNPRPTQNAGPIETQVN